jgi:hypothetical protein
MPDDMTFSFDDEEVEEEQERKNPVRELRNTLKARDKELKEYKKELEELRSFKEQYETEKRIVESTKSFEQYGLSAKHAELFHKVTPDAEVTPEAIKMFAEEYALPFTSPSNDEGGEGALPAPVSNPSPAQPFAPADTGTSADGYINRQQLDALYKENPAQALKYLRSGRVRWNNPDEN